MSNQSTKPQSNRHNQPLSQKKSNIKVPNPKEHNKQTLKQTNKVHQPTFKQPNTQATNNKQLKPNKHTEQATNQQPKSI